MSSIPNCRMALILYSEIYIDKKKYVHLLLPLSILGENITTFGGGRMHSLETDIECVIREVREESRNILDYNKIFELITSTGNMSKFIFSSCVYYTMKTSLSNLIKTAKKINNSEQVQTEKDEISCVKIFEIDDLIYDMVKNENKFNFTPRFKEMFLTFGYDFFNKNFFNHETKKLGLRVEYKDSISKIPPIVSLHPSKEGLDKIYFETKIGNPEKIYGDFSLYASDQYYGIVKGEKLFRK